MIQFVGLWYRQPPSSARDAGTSLARAIRPRDGAHYYFGPLALAISAPAGSDATPAVHPATGAICVADARLDNAPELRELLAAELGELAHDRTGHLPGAAELVLAAYLRWGTCAPQRLLGDFAIAVWDPRAATLLLARDGVGIRPLFYRIPDGGEQPVVFASRLPHLLAVLPETREVDAARVVSFLRGELADRGATFYRALRRLEPGGSLLVSVRQEHCSRFWEPGPGLQAPTGDQQCRTAFLETLTAAVRRRLQPGPTGVMLSGGLDSSAIACLARQLLSHTDASALPAYSARFPVTPRSDEGQFIEEVLRIGGFLARQAPVDRISPLRDLELTWSVHGEPVHAPNLYIHRALWELARDDGVAALLDGLDGDTTVWHGIGRLATMLRTEGPLQFFSQAGAAWRRSGIGPAVLARRFLVAPALARARRWLRPASARRDPQRDRLLLPEVRQAYPAGDSAAGLQPPASLKEDAVSVAHWRGWRRGILYHAFELATVDAAAHGLEVRFPFCDRTLIELCLGLPPEQKYRDGWTRHVMRASLGGVLPEAVRWRTDKSNLGRCFAGNLRRLERHTMERLFSLPDAALWEYLDPQATRACYRAFMAGVDSLEMVVWRAVVVGLWLERVRSGAT